MMRFVTKPWHRYGIAIAAVAFGAAVAIPVQAFVGGRAPFITFFPVITVVAAVAGFRPGVLGTVLSALIAAVVFREGSGAGDLDLSDLLLLGIYLFAGALIAAVGGSLRRAHLGRRESDELLKAVLDNAPGIIYMKDRGGVLRMVNRGFADLVGKPAERIIGFTDRATFGDTPEVAEIERNDREVLAGGRVVQLEEKMRHPEGEHTYFSIKVPFIYAGETLLCGFSTDITDRKRAEAYDRLLVAIDDAVRPLTDAEQITQTAARLLGEHLRADRCAYADVEADEDTFNLTGDYTNGVPSIKGRYRLADFGAVVLRLHREDKPFVVTDVETEPDVAESLPAYRRTMIRAVASVPLLKAGRFVAGMAVHQKVPRDWKLDEVNLLRQVAARCWESIERARIARDFRENEERLRMAQEAGGVGTFEFDVINGKSRGSKVFFRIFDAPPGAAELSAEQWAGLVHPNDRDEMFRTLRTVIETPDALECGGEYRLLLPNGTPRWVSYRGRLVRDATRRALKIIGTVADVTQRRLAEDALRQSEARFRALADGAPVPIGVSRLGRHIYVNSAFRQCFGIAEDAEIVGASILDHIAPEDRERIRENVRRRFAGEAVAGSYQFSGLRADDSRVTIDIRVGQIVLPDGPASIAFLTDVTERQRATDALAESESRFRATADSVPAHVWMDDERGRGVFANARYLEYTGLSTDQVPTNSWTHAVHPDDRDACLAKYRADADARADYRTEVRLRHRDGEYRPFEIIGRPRFEGGEFAGYVGIGLDVTERRQAQDRLRLLADAGVLLSSSLQYERSLVELARLVVPRLADWCAVDMLEGSGSLRRVAVVHPDPAKVELAHDLHRRFPPDPGAPGGTWQVIKTGRTACVPVITDEMLVASVADPEHLAALRRLALRSYVGVPLVGRGRVLGVLTLVYAESDRVYTPEDVSLAEDLARRAAVAVDNANLFEAERAARGEAERASRLKDEFLATLSHELRTPLNAILGWAQILDRRATRADNAADATIREGLAAIARNARAQTELVEDLLDMSRIVSGKLRLDVQTVVPADVVAAAIESILPAAAAKTLRVERVLDPSAGPVAGDPGRLQQVVWNLLTNAVKFTPRGGKIQVVLGRVDSHVEVSVSDTGMGIEPEFLPHMFERFRQADATTTRRHGGLGIGLALVKQMVELHGGTVRVESAGAGMGSTFTISLPVSIARTQPTSAAKRPAAAGAEHGFIETSLAGVSVLVVDDEPDAQILAKRILEERGALVAVVGTAKEGLEALRAARPAVVLSDIGMPDHDGYEFIAWVRRLPPEQGGRTPAAAFTAFARSEDRRRALLAGYQSHIAKPVEPSELVAVVASLVERAGLNPPG